MIDHRYRCNFCRTVLQESDNGNWFRSISKPDPRSAAGWEFCDDAPQTTDVHLCHTCFEEFVNLILNTKNLADLATRNRR